MLQQANLTRKAAHPKRSAGAIGTGDGDRSAIETVLAHLRKVKDKRLRRARWARLVKQIERRGGME